jgi:excisionase family DNA binding protein
MANESHAIKRSPLRCDFTAAAAAVPALLTRPEAAHVLGISLRATDTLIASGELKVVRLGANVRIRPSAIEYLLEARETRSQSRRITGRFQNRVAR